jgi:hypothetical protein
MSLRAFPRNTQYDQAEYIRMTGSRNNAPTSRTTRRGTLPRGACDITGIPRVLQATKPHPLVDQVKEQTNGLANGDMRQCSACGEVKSIDEFRDMKLARGYGRKCQNRKTTGRRRRRR